MQYARHCSFLTVNFFTCRPHQNSVSSIPDTKRGNWQAGPFTAWIRGYRHPRFLLGHAVAIRCSQSQSSNQLHTCPCVFSKTLLSFSSDFLLLGYGHNHGNYDLLQCCPACFVVSCSRLFDKFLGMCSYKGRAFGAFSVFRRKRGGRGRSSSRQRQEG